MRFSNKVALVTGGAQGIGAGICEMLAQQGAYDIRYHRAVAAKEIAARPFSAAVDRGDVALLDGPWVDAYLDEVCAFPSKYVHDDQVDPGGIAMAWLPWLARLNSGVKVKVGAETRPERDRRDPVRSQR